jgi:uncharacterized membrane-anchored protein
MKSAVFSILITLFVYYNSFAQKADSTELRIKEIEQSLIYKKGVIELESGNATLAVPKGLRYLSKAQSIYVLTDLWGNPADSSILGMLVPENRGVLDSNSWVFTISFDEMGYVKDDDADDIDYDDLLEEQQKEFKEANPDRIKEGYQAIEFIGWASSPHYDQDKKILHWAKELKFGQDSLNTLNYNLRVLGRKGVFMLNAVASMSELPEVKSNIDKVIGSVKFKDGHQYADFLPDVDNVAAWTIGGLVAGKVLAKVGFFLLLAKFWKLIALAITGVGSGIWKYFKRRKKDDQLEIPNKETESNPI